MAFVRALPNKSYQLDRGVFENHLGERARALGVQFLDGSRITAVELGGKHAPHQVEYVRRGNPETLSAQWVVDASVFGTKGNRWRVAVR